MLTVTVNSLNNAKYLKFYCGKFSLRETAIIREISHSYVETRRNGQKSGVSRIIRESLPADPLGNSCPSATRDFSTER